MNYPPRAAERRRHRNGDALSALEFERELEFERPPFDPFWALVAVAGGLTLGLLVPLGLWKLAELLGLVP